MFLLLKYVVIIEKVLTYMQHMEELKATNPNKTKRQKWLQDEHNRTFINWLREKVYDYVLGIL